MMGYPLPVAGSSSVPYAAPYPGGYSPPPLQLYGWYPQPQPGYGYLPQPGYGYPLQPPQPQPLQPGYGYPPQVGYGYPPQPQPPQPGYWYPPQPQPPQPGYAYAAPVQNLGTDNLLAKLGAALSVGVLSELIGNMIS